MPHHVHRVIALAVGILLIVGTLRAATEGDEVRFRPKRSAPAKAFTPKVYEPPRPAEVKRYEAKPFEARPNPNGTARSPQPVTGRPFAAKRSEVPQLPVYVGKPQAEKPFEPGPEEIRVRSIPADPNTVEEKKPFISGVKQREDKRFEAKAKKEGKNPLLTPRQGIKEEIRDDE